jgi:hypothetical protein
VTIVVLAVTNRTPRQTNDEFVTWEVTFSPSTLAGGRPPALRGAAASACLDAIRGAAPPRTRTPQA